MWVFVLMNPSSQPGACRSGKSALATGVKGPWRLLAVADACATAYKLRKGLARWQQHCFRVLCLACAVQNSSNPAQRPTEINRTNVYQNAVSKLPELQPGILTSSPQPAEFVEGDLTVTVRVRRAQDCLRRPDQKVDSSVSGSLSRTAKESGRALEQETDRPDEKIERVRVIISNVRTRKRVADMSS